MDLAVYSKMSKWWKIWTGGQNRGVRRLYCFPFRLLTCVPTQQSKQTYSTLSTIHWMYVVSYRFEFIWGIFQPWSEIHLPELHDWSEISPLALFELSFTAWYTNLRENILYLWYILIWFTIILPYTMLHDASAMFTMSQVFILSSYSMVWYAYPD